jgi:hypothetical protein
MQARQPVLIALASLAPCSHATLLIANACRRTRAGLAAVQTGCGLKLATAQRAQRHRLFSQPRQQTSPHCWPRRSLCTQKTRLQPAAASPADPYLKTAKLRQLLIVLDITDIRDLQSLIRQASACGAGCKSLVVSKSPLHRRSCAACARPTCYTLIPPNVRHACSGNENRSLSSLEVYVLSPWLRRAPELVEVPPAALLSRVVQLRALLPDTDLRTAIQRRPRLLTQVLPLHRSLLPCTCACWRRVTSHPRLPARLLPSGPCTSCLPAVRPNAVPAMSGQCEVPAGAGCLGVWRS